MKGDNGENCPDCADTNLPYPFICPGHKNDAPKPEPAGINEFAVAFESWDSFEGRWISEVIVMPDEGLAHLFLEQQSNKTGIRRARVVTRTVTPWTDAPKVPDHVCDTGDFDRTLCQKPCGKMHSYCDTCGKRQDSCAHDPSAGN